jgi:hypothetical protein
LQIKEVVNEKKNTHTHNHAKEKEMLNQKNIGKNHHRMRCPNHCSHMKNKNEEMFKWM